jgi:hypothetical protein
VARSGRAHTAAALRWCSAMNYEAELFDTVDSNGAPIYHTNVVLSIGTEFVTAGLLSIPDPAERARVGARLTASGREVVALDPGQIAEFAGNGLEPPHLRPLGARGGGTATRSTCADRAFCARFPDQHPND